MARILVIGAGVSGCTAAYTLAVGGADIVLIEKTDQIGGRVRTYGCKAVDDRCQNCGVCLTAGLWDKVSSHPRIQILTKSEVLDIKGKPGDFSVIVKNDHSAEKHDNIDTIIVSTGFDNQRDVFGIESV